MTCCLAWPNNVILIRKTMLFWWWCHQNSLCFVWSGFDGKLISSKMSHEIWFSIWLDFSTLVMFSGDLGVVGFVSTFLVPSRNQFDDISKKNEHQISNKVHYNIFGFSKFSKYFYLMKHTNLVLFSPKINNFQHISIFNSIFSKFKTLWLTFFINWILFDKNLFNSYLFDWF